MMMASGASEELPVGIAPARLPTTLFPAAFKGYTATLNDANNTRLFFLRRTTTTQGTTPLLLIHGYPQTHSLWYRFVQKVRSSYRAAELTSLRSQQPLTSLSPTYQVTENPRRRSSTTSTPLTASGQWRRTSSR
jgi:pimeloyl-ACP methyl ester carboxylesterase